MKAIIYEKGTSPSGLTLREVETPTPAEGEVLVKVHAVSINAADYRSIRLGAIPRSRIFGNDIAGRVAAVGSGVTKFKVGEAVFGDISSYGCGGFAEYAAAPERLLAHIPAGVSFVNAAALPTASLTALQGLRDLGQVQSGQKVLIYGAGGGVGNFAVQLARHFGADVTAVCSPRNVDLVRSLGAGVAINYAVEDVFTTSARYDLVLAINGNQRISDYQRLLKRGGKLVMVGGSLSQVIPVLLFGWAYSLGSKKVRMLQGKARAADLEYLIKLVEAGHIRPVIERTCALEETPEAVASLSQGRARGKVVIEVAQG